MAWIITREHRICCGHRVVGHESKCKFIHGHEYRFEFHVEGINLDKVGRVLDFGVIKEKLCMWLEDYWDHKLLMWDRDPMLNVFRFVKGQTFSVQGQELSEPANDPLMSVWLVPVNPTVENLAMHFVEDIAPKVLFGTNTKLVLLRLWETDKCSAIYRAGDNVKART